MAPAVRAVLAKFDKSSGFLKTYFIAASVVLLMGFMKLPIALPALLKALFTSERFCSFLRFMVILPRFLLMLKRVLGSAAKVFAPSKIPPRAAPGTAPIPSPATAPTAAPINAPSTTPSVKIPTEYAAEFCKLIANPPIPPLVE